MIARGLAERQPLRGSETMYEEIINGYKCSAVFDGDKGDSWLAETKLMPHADRLYHGPFATREAAEPWLRQHVPNWQPGYF
jgi:hypothetical protein